MSVEREVELKLELEPAAATSFKRDAAASLGSAHGTPKRLVSTYYDSRKQALRRRGLSLRIRQDGDRRIQTLKAENGLGAAIFSRPEWEVELPGGTTELVVFEDPDASALTGRLDRLLPLFETHIERTAWIVEEGSSLIEVAVDEGVISNGDASRTIAEVELELKHGSADDLFRLGRRMAEAGRLRLAVQSKSERGYGLVSAEPQRAFRSEPVALVRGMNVGQAFQAVARNCLRQFRLNETVLVERRTPDALHQARVGVRRLRSALSLFSDLVSSSETERIKKELRSLARLLGEARDIDVYKARLDKAGHDAGPGPIELEGRLNAERERAYDAVIRKLGSKKFRLFMIDLATWIESGAWLGRPEDADIRDEKAEPFAASVLDRRWRKIRKKGRRLDKLDEAGRHAVRIEAKKLRYASEFFAALAGGGKAKRRQTKFLSACEDVQACLGALNDIATGHALTERLMRRGPLPPDKDAPATSPFAARQTMQGSTEDALLTAAVAAQRELAGVKPFW